ncbi:hypothetical protein NFI96_009861 [Prochilodus magdalenae]|nr:hypothetical protein NFI96_009861 [Prochilodus magdalenae]
MHLLICMSLLLKYGRWHPTLSKHCDPDSNGQCMVNAREHVSLTLPPTCSVSELRIVLLGKNSSEISRVGNFILGRAAFDTEAPPPLAEWHKERARGKVEGRYITLISTPHLFDPGLSLDQLRVQSGSRADPVQENIIKQIITECRKQDFEFSTERSRSALIEVMENMVKENGGHHEWRGFLSAPPAAGQQQQGQATTHEKSEETGKVKIDTRQKNLSELRIVLLGKNSSEISRVGNLILSREAFDTEAPPPSVQQHSERARGKLSGKQVTLINTPCLVDFQLCLVELDQTVKESVYLCAPGPHVFLLVLQSETFRKGRTWGRKLGEWLNTYQPTGYGNTQYVLSKNGCKASDLCTINGETCSGIKRSEKHSGSPGRDVGKGGGLANEKENAKEKGSELRIILLGKKSSEISRVGNFILGREAFDTEAPPPSVEHHSERARVMVDEETKSPLNPTLTHLF